MAHATREMGDASAPASASRRFSMHRVSRETVQTRDCWSSMTLQPSVRHGEAMVTDLARWLEDVGLGKYAGTLAENDVDLEVLEELTEADLEKLGIPLGARKKLLKAIRQRGQPAPSLAHHQAEAPAPAAEAERRQLSVM